MKRLNTESRSVTWKEYRGFLKENTEEYEKSQKDQYEENEPLRQGPHERVQKYDGSFDRCIAL